jgi:hypothetical protein
MKELQSESSANVTLIKSDIAVMIMALVIITLLTLHLSQDVVYGYEPSRVSVLIGVPIAAVWLYATLALAGSRLGYLLLLFGSFFAAIVPVIHMSGRGVRAEVVTSSGGLFFMWGLIAIAMSASVSCLLSMHGLWRLRRSLLGIVLWCVIPVIVLCALFGYVVYARN